MRFIDAHTHIAEKTKQKKDSAGAWVHFKEMKK